jgi:hypothetical protein
MKAINGKGYTARDLAGQYRCDVRTIQRIGNELFGCSKPRVARYFDEAQATLILARLQNPATAGRQASTATVVAGIETEMTLDMELALIEKKAKELWKRKALEQEARAMRAESLLEDRTSGLSAYQRIAESAGLAVSDREDMLALYQRR